MYSDLQYNRGKQRDKSGLEEEGQNGWYHKIYEGNRTAFNSSGRRDGHTMQKVKTFFQTVWFLCISIVSPLWIGCIYMNITGHGKGYAYDLGSEADIAVFFGFVLLIFWLLAMLPVTVVLCKKCSNKRNSLIWIPLLAFAVLFAVGVCILGWTEFIKLFGYGYPA